MQVVSIPSNLTYFNIYSLSGYASTKSLILTNNTSSVILVLQASTPPLATTDAFPLYIGQTILIQGNTDPIWVKGNTGPLVVQDYSDTILPFNSIDPRVYAGTQAVTTQSFIEANCKNGVQYELATYDSAFLVGTNRDFVLLTGAKPILVKARLFSFTGDEISTTVYQNPVYTGGTPVTYYNLSTINPVTGLATLLATPTVSNPGTQISPTYRLLGNLPQTGQAVQTTDASGGAPELERVLAANSVFLFRTTNTGTVTSKFSSKNTWYEGELSVTT
ncbi:hypothetical protein [Pseudomonas phage vB_PsaM_M1]|nr:hypothetical protein [Pseudomonas phage vB_PsaM_M1]